MRSVQYRQQIFKKNREEKSVRLLRERRNEMIDLLIVALIFGYCTYVVVKRHQQKKNGGSGCGCSGGCAGCSGSCGHMPEIKTKE